MLWGLFLKRHDHSLGQTGWFFLPCSRSRFWKFWTSNNEDIRKWKQNDLDFELRPAISRVYLVIFCFDYSTMVWQKWITTLSCLVCRVPWVCFHHWSGLVPWVSQLNARRAWQRNCLNQLLVLHRHSRILSKQNMDLCCWSA